MTPADQLRDLEANYFDQPAHTQGGDLARINALCAALGLLPVDARLRPVAPATAKHTAPQVAAAVANLADAAETYAAFLVKEAALAPHRAYADAVARATRGAGMTPVRPLATMGTGGGPLLCDFCGKPMILEGGQYNRVYADEAWRRRTQAEPSFADRLHDGDEAIGRWKSYISGGMVVDREVNGTLRVFHGYRGAPEHCLAKADKARDARRAQVDPALARQKRGPLLAFLKHRFPDMAGIEQGELLGRILDAMYGFDPGLGVNLPNGDR